MSVRAMTQYARSAAEARAIEDDAAEGADGDLTVTAMEDAVRGLGAHVYLRVGASSKTGPNGRHLCAVAIMQENVGAKIPWRILGEGCEGTLLEAFEVAMGKASSRPRPRV